MEPRTFDTAVAVLISLSAAAVCLSLLIAEL